jgi:uncharacterized protein DUF6516
MMHETDHGLEFLLAFDGRVHVFEEGYWVKFEIKRVKSTKERPHGLSYSFTLHGPDGKRLLGFDNAHGVGTKGSRLKKKTDAHDHWHRTETDPGRPYRYVDAPTLLDDFECEAARILHERGVPMTVVSVDERGESK